MDLSSSSSLLEASSLSISIIQSRRTPHADWALPNLLKPSPSFTAFLFFLNLAGTLIYTLCCLDIVPEASRVQV